MSRKWKPGDLALAFNDSIEFRVVRHAGGEGSDYWSAANGTYPLCDAARSEYLNYRPLVVIDPEDREQVERLHEALGWPYSSEAPLYQALREFASPTPPRIDEPGTWGVVEASCVHDGTRCEWVKFPSGNWHTVHERAGDLRNPDDWDSLIDPVLVREGVSDD